MALGIVLFTIGFSVNVQATWQEMGFAALTGIIVALIVVAGDRIQRISQLTAFFAAVSVSAVVLLIFDNFDVDGAPIFLMIPALFFFIPGDILSASMYELAAGRITVGAANLVYAIFSLLLLFLGVVIGAALTGTPNSILFGEVVEAELPPFVPWLGWGLFAFGFMLAFAAPMRILGWVLLNTYVAFGAVQAGTVLFGEVVGTYLAATVMIAVALMISSNPARPPVMVLALSGFFVLTVGALGLEGFTALVSGDDAAGFTDLFKMLTIGMAIALGLLTGSALFQRASEGAPDG
jgi:uncharacterized membrane protein YjjB (DUF3815 family)